MIREADWVHSSGMCLTYDTSARETIIRIFEQAHDAGVPTSFDLNLRVDDGVLDPDFAAALERIYSECRLSAGIRAGRVRLFRRRRHDGQRHGLCGGRPDRHRPGRARGSIGLTQDGLTESPAFRVNVEDTIGAGDVYNAGFHRCQTRRSLPRRIIARGQCRLRIQSGPSRGTFLAGRCTAARVPRRANRLNAMPEYRPIQRTQPTEVSLWKTRRRSSLTAIPDTMTRSGIMLAVQHLDVLGITTIGGNCTLENVTRNAIKVLEVLGVADRIGVYPGTAARWSHRWSPHRSSTARLVWTVPCCRSRRTPHRTKHAVDFIVDTVNEHG